jgi:hypothetical protein
MKKNLIFLILIVGFSSFLHPDGHAADPSCDATTFACYTKKVEDACTKKWVIWNDTSGLGKITTDYSEFTSAGFNSVMATISANIQDPTEKAVIDAKLDALRNQSTDLFRSAEVVRIQYRSNMNSIFSCAIIASRQDKLERLALAIKDNSNATDIKRKVENEQKRYEALMSTMNCNQAKSPSGTDKVVDRLASSAMVEYCKYTYYLDYLEANINNNYTEALQIDASIGSAVGNTTPKNTDTALEKIVSRNTTINSERNRAQDTVPKAVMAFQEMDRTYVVHLLLTIIYDDYLKLRDNFNTYVSAVSQTFEKGYNAQDANQK